MKAETQVGLFILVSIAIFFYLSFNIGVFRFDGPSYFYYKVFSEDTSGLEKKAHIKIAGVTVGWVDSISLMDNGLAEIVIRVNRQHKLFRNSYAKIAQDGLIGSRTLELDPGDSSSGILPPGSSLAVPGKTASTVVDVVENFKEISDSIQDIVTSFQNVFATPEGEQKIAATLESINKASSDLSSFSGELNKIVENNKKEINQVCNNLVTSSNDINFLTNKIAEKTETFRDNVVATSENFKVGSATLNRAFTNGEKITKKIAHGEGTIGKLITDDSLFNDVKDAVGDVKNMIGKASNLEVNIDLNYARNYHNKNTSNTAEIKLITQSDWYYSIQLFSSKSGKIERKKYFNTYLDAERNRIDTSDPSFSLHQLARLELQRNQVIQTPNAFMFGFQFCKRFGNLTLKIGLFEGKGGVAAEYDFLLRFSKFRWLTRIEAFDFDGENRHEPTEQIKRDKRPHVRWANKVFFINNIYAYFGFDDIFSKRQGSLFWGTGINFNDDDLKYLFSFLPIGKGF